MQFQIQNKPLISNYKISQKNKGNYKGNSSNKIKVKDIRTN